MCDHILTDALYAFTYAELLMSVETQNQLKCDNKLQFDVKKLFFNRFVVANGLNTLLPTMCANVTLPLINFDDNGIVDYYDNGGNMTISEEMQQQILETRKVSVFKIYYGKPLR